MNENKIKKPETGPRGPSGGGPMGGGPMRGLGISAPKAKNFKGTMSKLIDYLGSHKITILFVWFLAVVSTVFSIFGPKILAGATDELIAGYMNQIAGTGSIDFGRIAQILLWLVGLYLISSVFSYLQGFVMSGVTAKVTFKMRNEINSKIHKLPLGYYDTTTHGDVISRITNDVDAISSTLNQSMTQIITSITSLIGITIMMLSISWQMTLVSLGILPLSVIIIVVVVKKSQKFFKDQQRFLGSVNGHVEEMLGSHVVVKAFNGEEQSLEKFDEYNDALYHSAWKANFLSGLMMPIMGFVGNLGYVAICVLGGFFTINGKMTIGGIQAFIQYARQFNQPITQIANISNVLQQTAAAAERVFEFLEEEEQIPEEVDALSVTFGDADEKKNLVHIDGSVSFDHVSFGYEPDTMVIHDLSLKVLPGQKVAIVGPTGAGKTTIVKLLMRFYDVNSGAILIDGQDIRSFKRSELRSLFGMVLQDTWLFNGTIADNIRYSKLGASDEEVTEVAKAAQVDHFVRTLPDGYNMILNEESDNISQGQKQLLTIARAILADPKILILDEATSSVDTRTEVLIQRAMDNLMKDRTSFIIAHRLSTIRNADLILVMNNGDIVEQGSHEELIRKKGFYADLYNSQFERAS
ncbi:MAG: ABC transporter ATP-binding protein [Tissierellia bacterium]|jgi:ATP-binding cassette subfamily B protein|nr:ABC transporter ATP-binding protein [Tissierellia bacterium]